MTHRGRTTPTFLFGKAPVCGVALHVPVVRAPVALQALPAGGQVQPRGNATAAHVAPGAPGHGGHLYALSLLPSTHTS